MQDGEKAGQNGSLMITFTGTLQPQKMRRPPECKAVWNPGLLLYYH